jgi:hypothetical protein
LVLITVIVCDYFLEELINCYVECKYTKIISAWNYLDNNIINKLKDNWFEVVFKETTTKDFQNILYKNIVMEQAI